MAKSIQVLDEKSIEELRSKKKDDSIALQSIINNAKASRIKIVEEESKRKAKDNDSEEIVSASSDLDKPEEQHYLSEGKDIPAAIDPEEVRIRYASLLWNHDIQKLQVGAVSDSETPLKPARNPTESERITIK
ncbi:hypothetical protein H5410_043621 [Solanum commersonii]|uniref:Uncharacterized protein n=1 Tax=Solanum commersonii TaxID=4109 RepID=A0A9J5XXN8_SOLCO|nr:hypothetical protein H5410_043621 [Solanum commersonii]